MKNQLRNLVLKYLEEIKNGSKELKKEIIFNIIKKVSHRSIKTEDIISIQIESIENEEDFFFYEILYTYFYVSNKERFNANRNLFLMHYIAADYRDFTIDLVQDCLNDIDENIEPFYSKEIKEMFLKCMSANENLSDELKLWLKLK
jgi:hypothetical protein